MYIFPCEESSDLVSVIEKRLTYFEKRSKIENLFATFRCCAGEGRVWDFL